MTDRATLELAKEVLRKVLASGRLHRIPRNPEHREIVLAILCLNLQRRYPYTEVEFNAFLKTALDGLHARVDHVTCRRYLVDFGFVKRDRAGNRYFVNYPKLESVLADDALSSDEDMFRQVLAESRRRSQFQR
jgi:hypothetical protein